MCDEVDEALAVLLEHVGGVEGVSAGCGACPVESVVFERPVYV